MTASGELKCSDGEKRNVWERRDGEKWPVMCCNDGEW